MADVDAVLATELIRAFDLQLHSFPVRSVEGRCVMRTELRAGAERHLATVSTSSPYPTPTEDARAWVFDVQRTHADAVEVMVQHELQRLRDGG